ncbi:MAG: DUF1800 family protein [Hyphomicrobiaceae bacterium]
MSTRDAAIAMRRLGLGAKPGDLKRIAADPRGYVAAQLSKAASALLDDPDLEPSHVVFTEAQRAQMQQKAARDAEKAASQPMVKMADAKEQPTQTTPPTFAPPSPNPPPAPPGQKANAVRRDALLDEISSRVDRAITTETPLLERLVYFWSNHFCVSAGKGAVRGLAGGYEREAIRPHVLGRFGDMLKATAQHPAMLIYLDNQISIGPSSKAGINRKRGLNENLAREILELHTLGVNGGYTQADVMAFAAILTGWSVGNLNQPETLPGRFFYAPNRHEPGAQTVLGKSYPDEGQRTGEAVLAALAVHPATAKHLATKLARHFIADAPPPSAVERLAAVFTKTGGDLGAVTRELIALPEVWSTPPKKIVPPFDFVVSIVRGFGPRPKSGELARLAAALGQPTWMVPSPKGWPDDDDAWMGPAPVRERLRIAEMLARQMDKLTDPRGLADDILGEALSPETRQAISRAESREQGFELLVMAPEFLRR